MIDTATANRVLGIVTRKAEQIGDPFDRFAATRRGPVGKAFLDALASVEGQAVDAVVAELFREVAVTVAFEVQEEPDVAVGEVVRMILERTIETCREEMVRNRVLDRTSSPFARAVSEAKLAGYARFVDEADELLAMLEAADAGGGEVG